MMKWINYILLLGLALVTLNTFAQKERKFIRQGNKAYQEENYDESEIKYRKAIDSEKKLYDAAFNIGDALYKQEKYEDAINQFSDLTNIELSKEDRAKIYHNLGNSLLQSNKIKESIEAYKQALRNNPTDMDTKYNLAYAQKQLENQQDQEQNQNQDQDQNKDQNKDQDQSQDQNQDQDQDQNKDQQDKQDQQQQQKPEISKQDAERILQALANDEKKTQKKVKEEKAKAAKVKVVKDW